MKFRTQYVISEDIDVKAPLKALSPPERDDIIVTNPALEIIYNTKTNDIALNIDNIFF